MLETARLELHDVGDKESYIDDIAALWTNSKVQITYEGNQSLRNKAKLKETASNYILSSHLALTIAIPIPSQIEKHCEKAFHAVLVLKETGAFIGECSIRVFPRKSRNGNFALAILPEYWGNGYATEASVYAIDHAFRWMALHRLSIDVHATNTSAMKLYTGLRFKTEGRRKEVWWYNGEWIDDYQLGLLDKEYWAQASASS